MESWIGPALGGLFGGAGSLFGGMMNTSSQQAINAAQLQFATQQSTGQFLPQYYKNLVAGATGAGINPLSVLGGGGSGGGLTLSSPRPGDAISGAGAAVGRALSDIRPVDDLAEKRTKSEIDLNKAQADRLRAESLQMAQHSQAPATQKGFIEQQLGRKPAFPGPLIDDTGQLVSQGLNWLSKKLTPYDDVINKWLMSW